MLVGAVIGVAAVLSVTRLLTSFALRCKADRSCDAGRRVADAGWCCGIGELFPCAAGDEGRPYGCITG